MAFESFEFISLTESLDIPSFECKDEDLNHFLWDDAKLYLKELMAVTYLLVDRNANQTVAYFSLLNDKVSYDSDNRSIWNRLNRKISNRKRRKTYPSVKVGRFAVSRNYEGHGKCCLMALYNSNENETSREKKSNGILGRTSFQYR